MAYRKARRPDTPPPKHRVGIEGGLLVERDAAVRMGDGTTLYLDILRPDEATRCPVLLAWSPYGKHVPSRFERFPTAGIEPGTVSDLAMFEGPDPAYWCRNGYAIAHVDPRGTWWSEGDAVFYGQQEAEDGREVVDWLGAQQWCNGRVGMLGVSYLARVQWFIAATQPECLAAISPWEGYVDAYRERSYHGGIPETRFAPHWGATILGTGEMEDVAEMTRRHPLVDEYWEARAPKLEAIEVPAYVVAGWADQGLHLRGTIEGFERISSEHRWLEVHGDKKWKHFYEPESVERQREFFDAFLKDDGPRGLGWSVVRYEVRERADHGSWHEAAAWPVPDLALTTVYLDARDRCMRSARPQDVAEVTYEATGDGNEAAFTLEFDAPTVVVGSMALRLWVEAEGSDDMDLFVAIEKLDERGERVPFNFYGSFSDGPVALGWLRVSHRALDTTRSRPDRPVHLHTSEARLAPGEQLPVEVELWPSATRFGAGERLQVRVMATDARRYEEGLVAMEHTAIRNAGWHHIVCGGDHDSCLTFRCARDEEGAAGGNKRR